MSISVLRRYPIVGFQSIAVFEPLVRVYQLDTVHNLDNLVAPRGWEC